MTNPYWPETTIFWGAGATASLGIPTTQQQSEILQKLADVPNALDDEKTQSLDERLEKINSRYDGIFSEIKEDLKNLFIVLGDDLDVKLGEIKDEHYEAFEKLIKNNRLFDIPDINKNNAIDRIIMLRNDYDWDALKRIAQICPKENFLLNLFNIIDFHLSTGKGLHVPDKKRDKKMDNERDNEKYFIENFRLNGAKSCLVFLIQTMISAAYYKLLNSKREKLEPYINFAKALANLMIKEGVDTSKKTKDFDRRDFYLFSYAVISMNFDPILLWLLFNAHKEVNDKTYIGTPAVPLKLFHDLGNAVASYKIKDEKGVSEDEEFKIKEDKKIKEEYEFDVLRCPYCGSLTEAYNSVMVMQTSFKNNLPIFLEEIQKEAMVCLENSKHIVLLGYSFPQDDLMWDIVMNSKKASIKKKNICCSVVIGTDGEKRWLTGQELEDFIKKHENEPNNQNFGIPTIKKMKEIFGIENLRAYTGGIPDVWNNGNVEQNVETILKPFK